MGNQLRAPQQAKGTTDAVKAESLVAPAPAVKAGQALKTGVGLRTSVGVPNLVIVESPTKAKEIAHFLGPDFVVRASKGHVRDLPVTPTTSRFGVDLSNWECEYEQVERSSGAIKELVELAGSAKTIYLATDPDREGEAISWHLQQILGPGLNYKRVTWSEINKKAVTEGLAKPREVDLERVAAQECRRILDRVVGYGVSPWLKKALGKKENISGGRVQSVALRLVVERDRDILAFASKGYGGARLVAKGAKGSVEAELHKVGPLVIVDPSKAGKPGTKVLTADEAKALRLPKTGEPVKVAACVTTPERRGPSAPFTTSTLQQEASRKLGISPEKTMELAQKLFEGLGRGEEGFITYHRTDSVNLSEAGIALMRTMIEKEHGRSYLAPKPRSFKAKEGAQESHEAIRPTKPEIMPKGLDSLGPDAVRLYTLIRAQSMACQMADQLYEATTVDLAHGDLVFQAKGTVTTFQGWRSAFQGTEGAEVDTEAPAGAGDVEKKLPALVVGEVLTATKAEALAKKTKPPKSFSEADLVKELEDRGIGRPSTYATIFSTIKARNFVQPETKGKRVILRSTELGRQAVDFLVKQFPQQMDYAFTRGCEAKLDEIAKGAVERNAFLDDFWGGFAPAIGLDPAQKTFAPKTAVSREIRIAPCSCPKCASPMVLKTWEGQDYASCTDEKKTGCKTSFDTNKDGSPKRICEDEACKGPVKEGITKDTKKPYAFCCACKKSQKTLVVPATVS